MRTIKKGGLAMFLFVFLLSLSFASAEILLGQTEPLYNVGDKFDLSIKVSPSSYSSNFLSANLICGDKEIELFKSPLSIQGGEQEEVDLSMNLDRFLISGTEGTCLLRANFGNEKADSQKFEITNDVSVTLTIGGIIFNPGETVNVQGQAKKANDAPLDGFVEVSIKGVDFSYTGPVEVGEFDFNFTIPNNAPSGGYSLEAHAYEKDSSGEITNGGNTSNTIRIRQVIKEVGIALNEQSVSPVEKLTYSIILYDQAKEHAESDVSVAVYFPDGTTLEKKIVKSGETNSVELQSNSAPGYWKIEAKSNDLKASKEFLVEEFRDVSFSLKNQTLIIKNTGNVPYDGPVEIKIGGINEVKELSKLAVGESKEFKLQAPDGEYDIQVGEGTDKQQLGTTFLTGKAISVQDVGGNFFGTSLTVLLGLIVLLVIAVVIVYFYRKISGSKSTSGKFDKETKITAGIVTKSPAGPQPQPNVIDKGEKQESSIISLKIKNFQAFERADSEANKAIDSALWKAKESGAKIYSDGEYRVMIFSPILTKEKDNSLIAVRVARTIERILQSYNRKSELKIDFGIGVNLGNLIVESTDGRFRFMSLDNVIATTKRISEASNAETLISESLHRKTLGRVKTEKLRDKNLWKIEKVVDRSAYVDHIKSLTKK